MKVGQSFSEPKKIRCSGCRTLILLTPDPTNPSNVAVSFPRTKAKQSGMTETHKRIILYSAFGAMCLFLAYALWSGRTPPNRAAVEGKVTIDGVAMNSGTIRFDSFDGKFSASGEITRGTYSISAAKGPWLGMNKVKIKCVEKDVDRVAPRFNAEDQYKVEIKAGTNNHNFDPLSK
jgi:hypothetical protein